MRRLILLLTLILLLAACVQPPPAADEPLPAAAAPDEAEAPTGTPLPSDPAVRMGRLANGLTWYIRPNAEPQERAELWLAVNAGSNQESDEQLGLAHFLEHMLFNGTESYPATELVTFLESLGMQFGPDVNAYTSFEETVYTLQVPTDDPAVIAQAVHVLKEWAADATLDPAEVDKERGVVVEEWRLRDLNAQGRTQDEIIAAILGGSRYADRLPIGDMEIVRNAPADLLRAYYETWYRPDNMAVIAVGDFPDMDAIQALIEEEFGGLTNPETPLERFTWSVPDYGETEIQIITDPELTSTDINVVFKQEPAPGRSEEDLRSELIARTALRVLNYRYEEITQGANPPFLFAVGDAQPFVRAADISILYASLEPEGVEAGLSALMTEAERLRRFGVTQAELDRARTDLLRTLQSQADEAQNTPSSSLADALLDNFLLDEAVVNAEDAYELALELFPTVTIEEVNAAATALFPTANRVVLLVAPEGPDGTLPTAEALASVIADAEAAELEALAEAEDAGPLLAEAPAAAEIVETQTLTATGITVVTFDNGLELWLKPTDFKDDEVLFELASPGGVSAVADDLAAEATWVTNLVGQSGVGDLDLTQLQRALTGSTASVTPYIDESTEGITGMASPQDLETMFQLIYLYATQPRLDGDALSLFQRQVDAFLADRGNEPESLLDDRLVQIRCGEGTVNPRCNFLESLAEVGAFDAAATLDVYKERFGDFADARALVVGSFDVEEVTELAARYLGTLPTDGRSERWSDRLPPLPELPISEDLFKGIDPRSYVFLDWTTPFTPDVESRVQVRALEGVLDILVREDLREARGGIYGAGVSTSVEAVPNGELDLRVQFTAQPTRVVELVGAVEQIVVQLAEEGPTEDVLERAKAQLLSSHEENLELNEAWLSWLRRFVVTGEGPADDILTIDEAIEGVTAVEVQALAARALPLDGVVRLVLYPEEFTPEP